MNTTMYGVYSSRSRGLPMVFFRSKWHATSWIAQQRPGDKYASKYWVQRVQIRSTNKDYDFVVTEHVGYKHIFKEKIRL